MSECYIIIILSLDKIAEFISVFPIPTNVDIVLDIRRKVYLHSSIKVWLRAEHPSRDQGHKLESRDPSLPQISDAPHES